MRRHGTVFVVCRGKWKEEQKKAGEALKANTHCTGLETITALLRHSELLRLADQHSNDETTMNGNNKKCFLTCIFDA